MNYIATITSKRQFTIPADIFNKLNLHNGEKLLISPEGDYLKITPALRLVKKLAGSVGIPEKYRNLSLNEIISKAKTEHFKK